MSTDGSQVSCAKASAGNGSKGSAPPRNARFGEFWFGRLLSLLAVFGVFAGSSTAFALGVRGAEAVKLLSEAFWVLLVVALVYNGRAAVHDRLANAIRAIRERE